MTQCYSISEFVVLTGFLGTGKTTLLSNFLVQPESSDTAVIINEVGQINIDGAIIAETGRLPVALLSNGCVCCSVTNDLQYTVEALLEGRSAAGLPPFRRIVLECSGLARPSSVLRSLEPLRTFGMPTRIVTTIDAAGSSLDIGFEEAAAQLAAAQMIVLTKLDQADSSQRQDTKARLWGINPLARVVDSHGSRQQALEAFCISADGVGCPQASSRSEMKAAVAHPRVEAILVTFPTSPSWTELEEWLENLAGFCGDNLLRIKGIITTSDCTDPILIQGVGTLFGAPRRMTKKFGTEGVIVIVRDLPLPILQNAPLGRTAFFCEPNFGSQIRTWAY